MHTCSSAIPLWLRSSRSRAPLPLRQRRPQPEVWRRVDADLLLDGELAVPSDRHVDAVELAALRRRERERPRRLRHDARHARRLDREAQPLHLALVEQVERRRAAGELMQPRRHAVRRVADADAQDLGARGDERDAAGGDEREGGGARRDREVELVAERELHRGHRHRDLHEAAGRLGGDEERTVAVPAAEGEVPLLLAELELAAGAERGGVAVEQGSAAEHGVDDGGQLRVPPRDGGEEEARVRRRRRDDQRDRRRPLVLVGGPCRSRRRRPSRT